MIELIKKDFLLLLPERKKGRVTDILFTIVFLALFLLLEVFLFSSVMAKVEMYDNMPECIFTAFLLLVLVGMTISGLSHAERLFFQTKDMRLVCVIPVPLYKILLSKATVFFVTEWLTTFLFSYPLFVSYGLISDMPGGFYALSLLYPLCSLLLETAFVLLFITPLHTLLKTLKKHRAVYAVLVVAAMAAFSVLYYFVLTFFIGFVLQNQDGIFSTYNLQIIQKIFDKAIPMIWLARAFVEGNIADFGLFMLFSLGLLLVDGIVFIGAYSPSMRFQPADIPPKKLPKYKKCGLTATLVRKEFFLLAQSDRLFSFLALLIVQPFLFSLIVSAIGNIFSTGIFFYYTAYLPQFLPLTYVFIALLFTLIVNQSANRYFSAEENMGDYLHTLPVSYEKQTLVKLAVPYVCSMISLTVSLTGAAWTGLIDLSAAIGAEILSAILLCGFELASLHCERYGKNGILYIYLYALPSLFWASGVTLSYVCAELPITLFLLAGGILFTASLLPFLLPLGKKSRKKERKK